MTLSHIPFCQGDRNEVFLTFIFELANKLCNDPAVRIESLSWIIYSGTSPYGGDFDRRRWLHLICCITHAVVGFEVTPKCSIFRLSWLMIMKIYRTLKQMVGTTQKSIAQIPFL